MQVNKKVSTIPEFSFKDYLFKTKSNKRILLAATGALVIQFIIFKYLYPFASFIHGDSFSYLDTAHYNYDINTYLVGYSRFLRLFSVFTSSDTALVAFQYLFIQSSALFLLFTIFYFYHPARAVQYILLSFMVLNPLFLHMANLISSDVFFTSLSLTWFALLLWIIHRPTTWLIIWQALALFLCFTVRYNALLYPLITVIAFCLSRLPLLKKIAGIAAGILLCSLFVVNTGSKYKQLTGYWQYSPFSGWQLANNAMYIYRYVDSSERKPVPKRFETLDKMIRSYFDTTKDVKKFPIEEVQAGTFYMWSPGLPLMTYRNELFKKDTIATELKRWASMGPLYKSYGLHIIKQYPWHFLRYFIWPNANKYYAPPVEFLDTYNSGKNDVTPLAKTWFGYKSRIINTRMKDPKVYVLEFYPILSGIINVVMLGTLLCYALLKGFYELTLFRKGVALGGTVWLLNAGFTISASSAALRFQSFPILITTIFSVLLLGWLGKIAMNTDNQELKKISGSLEADLPVKALT